MSHTQDFSFDPEALESANRYLSSARKFDDGSYSTLLCFSALNLFLWHLDAFEGTENPNILFAKKFNDAANFLELARTSGVSIDSFKVNPGSAFGTSFESDVSGLFSDIWVDMTDDIYFDETYQFTCERLNKNGIDPQKFFRDKVVVDGGCGSGKFSATIGRLGAKRVIGVDIGKKGLDFANKQKEKVPYGASMEFMEGSLLSIPLGDNSVDMVWSNGVIHHTLDYDKCVEEFARITRPGGEIFLYVNGRFGLFELLQDTIRKSMENVPKQIMQTYLHSLGINTGRIYWIMDCCFAPYEWRSKDDVISLLQRNGYTNIQQLTRGVEIDQIEKISSGKPNAKISYGEGQLKFIAKLQK